MKTIVILTGAGMSAESSINTFRDTGGLWEGHDVMEVASPEGFRKNPALVLEFYNQRRRQLKEVEPNQGHKNLVKLEEYYHVHIVTQNVDDLHERAGSSSITHLHGQLRQVRSTLNPNEIWYWEEDISLGDTTKNGDQIRPHIVWFGEAVPMIEHAVELVEKADIIVIIGTSMQVYPAAGLINYAKAEIPIYFIDPNPNVHAEDYPNLEIIQKGVSEGTYYLIRKLID